MTKKNTLPELRRQLAYGTTMAGRLAKANRRKEAAYEAKLTRLRAKIAKLEAEKPAE